MSDITSPALCMAYRKSYGFDARIVRLFNSYGPRIRGDGGFARAVSRFISQALGGEDITVFGEGEQTRSFCYITDTISGILRVAADSTARGDVFNIGNPREITIMDLAHRVRELAGSTSRIVHRPLPPDDPQRRCPDIFEKIPGVDVVKVAEGMGLDERIGKKFLNAGAGFGGSCFPKDVNAIVAFAKSHRHRPRILESVLEVNKEQATHVAKLIKKRLGTVKGKRVAVLGLSFKPGTDDLREAPSLRIIEQLLKERARVVVYDPVAINNTKRILGNKIAYAASALSCLQDADAAVIVTEWDEFKDITPNEFLERMRHPIVIDARCIYDADRFSRCGIRFSAIGLGPTDRSAD